ncbi:myb family transcription factor PHL8-like isoform X2 [Lotus japonicus]|uniref:myb family transcription factor PHL8-like isoform X2 n=1 Tax=Lotus japonicus TaxID=34305 RepID=UPI00258E1880|nr:myb family transcription factor PHL8-like isoform X2 [Lotus japonicus]
MGLQNQSVHFVLSTDAKPRLKWTPELHQRFIEATNQLGEATPKNLMRVMGIPGLTLYHLKSHLQKYRLGKSQVLETCSDSKQEDDYDTETKSSDDHCSREISFGAQNQNTENLQIAEALQMQMEVQRKLYEQIEVQKHLQLRIEAQGKYLQSVLKKAQEALSGYNNTSPVGIELTKSELSQLVTMINHACPNSPTSELTETRGLSLNCGQRKRDRGTMCSLESSLTSSESSGRREEKQPMEEEIGDFKNSNTIPLELTLLTVHHEDKASNGDSSSEANGRKRSAATKFDGSSAEQPPGKRCSRKPKLSEMLDLNSQCESDMDSTSSKTALDLNCSPNFSEP